MCKSSGILPCVCDAAVFSSYDEEWTERSMVWYPDGIVLGHNRSGVNVRVPREQSLVSQKGIMAIDIHPILGYTRG